MSTKYPKFFKLKKYTFIFCIVISLCVLILLLIAIYVGKSDQYLDHFKGLQDKFNPNDHNLTVKNFDKLQTFLIFLF